MNAEDASLLSFVGELAQVFWTCLSDALFEFCDLSATRVAV